MPTAGFLDISIIAPRIQGPRGADRGFVAGRSGAGKSFLVRHLLPVYGVEKPRPFRGHVIIIDANGTFDYPANKVVRHINDFKIDKKDNVILYRPNPGERFAEHWNELFKRIYLHPDPSITYADETFALEPLFGQRRLSGGNWLTAILTSGRAKAKAVIMGAQRPVNIPRNIIGQAEWFYVFDLPIEDDRAVIAGTIGEVSDTGQRIRDRNALKRFEFWFKGPDQRDPVKAQIVK